MSDDQTMKKRNQLFLFGCIVTRLLLTYFSYKQLHLKGDFVSTGTTFPLKGDKVSAGSPKYTSSETPPNYLKILGWGALFIGIGFITLYTFGWRKTGREVFGDKIWWNDLRPLHGTLYLLFAYYTMSYIRTGERRYKNGWVFLAIDVMIGFLAFVNNRIK